MRYGETVDHCLKCLISMDNGNQRRERPLRRFRYTLGWVESGFEDNCNIITVSGLPAELLLGNTVTRIFGDHGVGVYINHRE